MSNKRTAAERIGLGTLALVLTVAAGYAALTGTGTAQAAPTGAQTTQVKVSPDSATAWMRAAERRCATAPKNVRRACWSLYLRPAFGDIPAGRDIVNECYGAARVEAQDYPGPRTWADYLRGCILGNIETP